VTPTDPPAGVIRQRKAQDVRNQQVQYLIDQNNKRRK
jgi:hypothetical protein